MSSTPIPPILPTSSAAPSSHGLAPHERIAVALDVATLDEAQHLASRLAGRVGWFKVGLELFVAHGPASVTAIAAHGPVFLDLKLHDIPTTVARAVGSAARLDVGLLTIHTSGGASMMRAAREAAGDGLRLLGVTVLTSTSDAELAELGVEPARLQVPRLAALATDCGIDGLVCAPTDLGSVRAAAGTAALLVTPGIRASEATSDDHARAMSAPQALAAGADLLVIGRPITRAADPVEAVERLVASLAVG
jgi:orotidine-5'-phosphate decarboxylase